MNRTSKVEKIEREVLPERISSILREGIIEGKFSPGERLPEIWLAQQLGVSRPPLREAFRILEKEGLIEIVSQKGARVKDLTPKDVESIYQLRTVLDSLAVRLALANLQEKDIARLEALAQQMKICVRKKDTDSYQKLNSDFHSLFYRRSDNEWLCEVHEGLMKHIMRLRLFSLSMSERLYQSYQEHLRIFEAVKKRDVLGAEEAMKQHIADAGKFVYQLFIRNNKTIVPAVNRSGEFKA